MTNAKDLPPRQHGTGASPLEHALNAERALTLGKLGREVEAALRTWQSVNEVRRVGASSTPPRAKERGGRRPRHE